MVGTSSTYNVTLDTDAKQGAFEIVHSKTFAPNPKPVIDVVGDNEFVIVPEPETNDQVPTPTVAVLAVITVVGEEIQSVCVIPAFETVGTSFTTSVTFETEDKHGIFEIVQANTLFPKPKPVIVVFGEVGLVIAPLPETKVHIPVPIVGVLAVIVVVGDDIQSV
jgi:hypothetical protein